MLKPHKDEVVKLTEAERNLQSRIIGSAKRDFRIAPRIDKGSRGFLMPWHQRQTV